jgi:hypothetical protein
MAAWLMRLIKSVEMENVIKLATVTHFSPLSFIIMLAHPQQLF